MNLKNKTVVATSAASCIGNSPVEKIGSTRLEEVHKLV
jgi:hypothetical protein